jgi:hypothetical protein
MKNAPTKEEKGNLWKEHMGKMSNIMKKPMESKTNANKILVQNGAQYSL